MKLIFENGFVNGKNYTQLKNVERTEYERRIVKTVGNANCNINLNANLGRSECNLFLVNSYDVIRFQTLEALREYQSRVANDVKEIMARLENDYLKIIQPPKYTTIAWDINSPTYITESETLDMKVVGVRNEIKY